MIEIRRLTEQEIPFAAELAKLVYRCSIEPNCQDQDLRRMFEEYVDREALRNRFCEGGILLWGAIENAQICGVGGMQPEGHITMLYVVPQYQKRNIGTNLLSIMQMYAFSVLKHTRVTVSAMPAWTASYFEKNGFRSLQKQPQGGSYLFLEKKNTGAVVYRKRPMSGKEILLLILGTFVVITAILLIYAASAI